MPGRTTSSRIQQREEFNLPLFRKLGSDNLGILGLTVSEMYTGTNFDASAVALVHEELSYSDPAFCLSYLAHSLLFANNLAVNGNDDQNESICLPYVKAVTSVACACLNPWLELMC
jgi:isovaleryl-CoA dehydrogenase